MAPENARPIVDFATHFYKPMPEVRRAGHAAIEDYAGAPICTDMDAFLEQYEAAGIDAGVVSQPFHVGSSDLDTVTQANDELLDIVESYDELYGLASIPVPAGGEAAAHEFERALDAGYHGGVVETESDSIELIDRELEPVFEVADRTRAPILVHPKLHDSLGEDSLDDYWHLNVIFGREVAMAASISKVIHEGIYDRYSDLKLVFHHNGGNIGAALGRIEGSLARAHRAGDDHLKTYEEFMHVLETRVYFDTAGYYGDASQFQQTLESVPAKQLLFASDFPYETVFPGGFQKIVDAITEIRGGAERDAILGGNALDLLINV